MTRIILLFLLLANAFALKSDPRRYSSEGLYGIDQQVQLVKIDIATGTMKQITSPLPYEMVAEGLDCLDQQRGIYYIIGFNASTQDYALIGLSLSTGEILTETALPFLVQLFVGVGQHCNVIPGGDVLVVGKTDSNLHQILRVDFATKKISSIASFTGETEMIPATSAFDSKHNRLFLQGSLNEKYGGLFGWDIATGKKIYSGIPPYLLEAFNYDPTNDLIYSFSVELHPKLKRQFVSFNTTSYTFKLLGDLDAYPGILGAVSTIDVEGRRMISMFLPNVGNFTTQNFYLTAINIDNMKTLSQVSFCNLSNCPWSFHYYQGSSFSL